MKSFSFLILIACSAIGAFQGCMKSNKEKGTIIYIEVERMDPKLENCFSKNLYGKWASAEDPTPHDKSEKYTGPKPEGKFIFKSYDEFDISKDPPGTQKIMVTVYGDGDTTNTYFQIQRFQVEEAGIWSRNLNLGNFRVQDRPNDQINPGKVDDEEICNMMVRFCILASFENGLAQSEN